MHPRNFGFDASMYKNSVLYERLGRKLSCNLKNLKFCLILPIFGLLFILLLRNLVCSKETSEVKDVFVFGEIKPNDENSSANLRNLNGVNETVSENLNRGHFKEISATNQKTNIYFVFPFPANDFNFHNYRALESYLNVYPDSESIEFFVVGPFYAKVYGYSNALSKTHFEKYSKRGYNVKVRLINGNSNVHVRESNELSGKILPGADFWERHKNTIFYGRNFSYREFEAIEDALPDYATVLFLICLELYKTGGIYGDLTLFQTAPLPKDADGFVAGGMNRENDLANYKCSALTTRNRKQLPLLMQFSKPRDPVLNCTLIAYDDEKSDLNKCIGLTGESEENMLSSGKDGGLSCVLDQMGKCMKKANRENELAKMSPVDWRNCDGEIDSNSTEDDSKKSADLIDSMVLNESNGPVAFWLGKNSSNGNWSSPQKGSWAHEAFSRIKLDKWKSEQEDQSCKVKCNKFPIGSSKDLKANGKAKFQCSPTVFVPATQKGASTFLFHGISTHPQFLSPLRGSQGFKETGRYMSNVGHGDRKLGTRMNGFPFIEENENFVTGDGSVEYMLDSEETPEQIKRDSPQAKIVFALRNPAERAWSDYRFLFHNYKKWEIPFRDAIEKTMPEITKCFSKHLNGIENDDKGIEMFYQRSCIIWKDDPGILIRKGLYFYPVLHWINTFGKENVFIVESEDLKLRPQQTFQKIYKFIGLCPTKIVKLKEENVTGKSEIPDNMKIDKGTYEKMQIFFEPYNKKLYELIGRDLGW